MAPILRRCVALAAALTLCALGGHAAPADEPPAIELPTGQTITPTAAAGAVFQSLDPKLPSAPDLRPGQAIAVAASPDGQLLAILTGGYNRYVGPNAKDATPDITSEYLFLFDITTSTPKQMQVLELANTFQGLAWAPSSDHLFVSGGKDDSVIEMTRGGSAFDIGRTFKLGHTACVGLDNHDAAYPFLGRCSPVAGSIAVSPDGGELLVANLENDSVSLVDLKVGKVLAEQDLRPGMINPRLHGTPGGSFPRSVTWISKDHAYVASERDRELIALKISGTKIRVEHRIPVPGQPVAIIANRRGSRVYAALSTTAKVAVIDTRNHALLETIDATAPRAIYPNDGKLGGANSNALALTPDERTLLVSNGGENAIAVVRLGDRSMGRLTDHGKHADEDGDDAPAGQRASAVIGLVPTGWYPTGVATAKDGGTWYVINAKSETGANTEACPRPGVSKDSCDTKSAIRGGVLREQNRFVFQLEKAGFLTLPAPNPGELTRLTLKVARNDHFDRPDLTAADAHLFEFLRRHIQHVIYIIKENRSYDQVLGDLEVGNGDPRLTLFPEKISPNHHAIARNFVTADNFLVSGEVSWSGWDWAVSAQTSDYREHQEPLASAHRGMDGEATGFNRNINMGYRTSRERHEARSVYPSDPDILPGERDVTAPDGPSGEEGSGHLWDAALHQGLTLRNWGFFGENEAYDASEASLIREPFAHHQQVFFATKSALAPYSDPYYLDFAPNYPDFWRVKEWQREFAKFSDQHPAPRLMLIRLGNDHFGAFAKAIDGVNTPETQMADNDYALGRIVQAVAESPFAHNTLIVSIEDDACDGPDHIDSHRSIALFAGAYVRPHALVSKRYTTVSVVKTIEEILGVGPIGLNDALAAPMSEMFDPNAASWGYQAIVPDILRSTKLPLPPAERASNDKPSHSAAYWARAMAGQDFSGADRIDPAKFNRALWRGLKGDVPYPD